ncbi:MAG: methyl-accepting chemotaxis protein [Bryobacteraceae bacterium]
MAKQANNGRRVDTGRKRSTGIAVSGHPTSDAVGMQPKDRLEAEILRVASAFEQGRLAERVHTDAFEGGERRIVDTLNGMLDSVVGPLKVAAECTARMAKGEIPSKITGSFNGDFNTVVNDLNACIDGLGGLVEANAVLQRMAVNDYTKAVGGRYTGIYAEVAAAVNTTQQRVGHVMSTLQNVAKGDLAELPEYKQLGRRSERDSVVPTVIQLMESLKAVVSDAGLLAKAAVEGMLDTRADITKHQGEFRKVVEGLNQTMEAVIGPTRIAAGCMARIAKGEIPPKITQSFSGDYNAIISDLNACIDGLSGLVEANAVLQRMALNDYSKAVEGNYAGVYAELAAAVNATRQRVISIVENFKRVAVGDFSQLAELKRIGRRSERDEVIPSVVLMMENIETLVGDAATMAKAAVEGNLSTRADATRHQGEFRKVVEGLNQTMEAIVSPIHVAAVCMALIAKGEIPAKITETFNGDYSGIINNLNACIDGLSGLVEANAVLQRMAVNDYTKAVEGHYTGIYAEVAAAVNATQQRVTSVVEHLKLVAAGDFGRLAELKRIGRRSEHDEVIPSVVLMMENIEALVGDAVSMANAAADGQVGQRADAGRHHGEFRKVIEGLNKTLDEVTEPLKAASQSATAVATSSEELMAVSHQMAGNAEETATQANVVSAASEQVSKNVSSVASASEQMQASIREIAKHANESARVAKNAVSVAHSTNETVRKLGESSQEIGNVIKVITSIAQQTNLLALNATIEAARAGEAGKGFAVVANEVKELAKQTAKATEEIGRKIEAIQGDTKGAVTAIEEIGSIINQINDISNSIASAVEEQTVTTSEIGRSVTEAAKGVGDIAKNIGGVAVAAKDTTQGANETQKASQELSQMAARLQMVIAKFKF